MRPEPTPRIERISLARYIRLRNGVPAGARGSLRNMLRRSLGASSFAAFWRHWNPVFGYVLSRYVHRTLRRLMPASAAVLVTFVVCGAFHDLISMGIRRSAVFLFTPWFFFLGLGVVLGGLTKMNLSGWPWRSRAAVNLGYVLVCLLLALLLRSGLGIA